MKQGKRGWFLTTVAMLFVLLAISNFLKPVLASAQTGFVFFGRRLSGLPNDILGPVFGFILVALAILIWRMRRPAVTLAWAYTAYVVANTVLYAIVNPPGAAGADGMKSQYARPVLAIVFLIVGLGVPLATAVVLTRRRAELA
ncbi:MAG: hypothetical protein WAU33_05030 [Candidatus Binataceae bacterium]